MPLKNKTKFRNWTQADPANNLLGPSRDQVEILTVCKREQAIPDLLTMVGRTGRTKFHTDLLNPLLGQGLVEMTIPDKPKSSKQRYRITEKGHRCLTNLGARKF
ncbi:putative transcriptional regulator [Desulforapulum autotrophicum HRM2]|uniref:Transcriptional regulator n=1 Tax=Desulforapulum autotrophicum (strain ATCC 43914 / DSM 3382 / VKM B-1955 / HRM2) TaxID=177437 RepID=C0QIJ9_DESAH|nr:putative transcriptional regulator [Desulforapulum autotrophicum HRM2]